MAKYDTHLLLTAHHRDDLLETFFMRIARGGNLDSISAPGEIQRFRDGSVHLRPLLQFGKGDILAYLRARGICWCEDETNAQAVHTRNRLRLELIPLWKTFEPGRNWEASVLRTRTLLAEDGEALSRLAEEVYARAREGNALLLQVLQKYPRAILRRVLHLHLLQSGRIAGRGAVESALEKIAQERCFRLQVCAGCYLVADGHGISIEEVSGPG
jgi:tRNA(Ile)-lysidine synthase TilS/MesJ